MEPPETNAAHSALMCRPAGERNGTDHGQKPRHAPRPHAHIDMFTYIFIYSEYLPIREITVHFEDKADAVFRFEHVVKLNETSAVSQSSHDFHLVDRVLAVLRFRSSDQLGGELPFCRPLTAALHLAEPSPIVRTRRSSRAYY